jgi:hypothetical protein
MQDELKTGNLNSLCGLLSAIHEFAKPDYQNRIWVRGLGSEVSSYSEAMVSVLEDFRVKEFGGQLGIECGLRSDQVEVLRVFGRELDNFNSNLGATKLDDDASIVRHPNWGKIVNSAAEVIARCEDWYTSNCKLHPDYMVE